MCCLKTSAHLTPVTIISLISTFAILLGIGGVLPQIAAMVRRRSAAGQSPVGWFLGVTVNVLMGYVNLAGYGATTLALGNACGGLLCLVALGCAVRLPRAAGEPSAVRPPDPLEMSTGDLSEMLTTLARERQRREARRREAGVPVPDEAERELLAA